MALKGIDIFKLTPKTNCKECGQPTCMAFGMKVAQGTAQIEQCPHMSEEALAKLGEATAPPMKSFKIGPADAELSLGGETVLFRHDKTFVSKTLFAVSADEAGADAVMAEAAKIDYERIGERMRVDIIHLEYAGDTAAYVEAAKKSAASGKAVILSVSDEGAAREALSAIKDARPVLNGANPDNREAFAALAKEFGVSLGVSADSLDALHETVQALEKDGVKDIILDVGTASIKSAFANAVQIRRAAIKSGDHSFGYPSLVNVAKLAPGDAGMQTALASLFILKYGSIVVMEGMSYAQALPLFGLRQNIYTDPQKPMTVETGNYPLNGADENSVCAVTVDFALTYFIVSGEIERSGIPVNLIIPDAGGYSVLTAWSAGKFSAGSIAAFIKEADIESKVKNRNLLIPGKVAVLKGELEENLPGWNIIVSPGEATSLVKFLKELDAA
ncbi:MAG: acetyl-CoA decarbonylase/synthase complex subunit gamma [Clostridiales Family XIII bacterium]|jgi:acetyl-CoA decarbonylase/synthase complex subunit gamma|nr:acetyl-CoA decarbonylase/synthase complex subunit gamma [Clostridiales Family XIII bacterium]